MDEERRWYSFSMRGFAIGWLKTLVALLPFLGILVALAVCYNQGVNDPYIWLSSGLVGFFVGLTSAGVLSLL